MLEDEGHGETEGYAKGHGYAKVEQEDTNTVYQRGDEDLRTMEPGQGP